MKPRTTATPCSLGLNIHLLYQPLGLVSAVAHWISDEVMHVDTGRVVLQHLSEVEITFPFRREGYTAYHRIIAHVCRRTEQGTILRFVRCSRDAYQALRELTAHCAPA
ncbi:MAG TPA: hypothetical protein VGE50_06690 [Gammaproteobacteria bacterium]